tara:strand:- start:5718 stop:6152 length:435 start_codon:yes stop_codon:yes gene_type:complete
MPNTPPQLMANGNIRPLRFVKIDVSADEKGIQATDNSKIVGVSQPGTNFPPLNDSHVTLDGMAAIAGETFQLYGEGDDGVLVEIGAAVVRGDYLKSDSVGRAVPIATSGTTLQRYGAEALQSGAAAGEFIRVHVRIGSERPAIA